MPSVSTIATGAEMRVSGSGTDLVLCVNGGGSAEVEGTWSASVEWLVERLCPEFPGVRFAEVRYRIKSWRRLDLCVADGEAALEALDPVRTLMLGFSMGGSVSVSLAKQARVAGVIGLAPWLPPQLSLAPLDGKRLAIVHGALDSPLPGIPGVSPKSSHRAYEEALARGIDASYTLLRGALHGVAVRSPFGGTMPLPRAGAWLEHVTAEIERFRSPC